MGLCSTQGLTELETLSVASSGIWRIAQVLYFELEILVRLSVENSASRGFEIILQDFSEQDENVFF